MCLKKVFTMTISKTSIKLTKDWNAIALANCFGYDQVDCLTNF